MKEKNKRVFAIILTFFLLFVAAPLPAAYAAEAYPAAGETHMYHLDIGAKQLWRHSEDQSGTVYVKTKLIFPKPVVVVAAYPYNSSKFKWNEKGYSYNSNMYLKNEDDFNVNYLPYAPNEIEDISVSYNGNEVSLSYCVKFNSDQAGIDLKRHIEFGDFSYITEILGGSEALQKNCSNIYQYMKDNNDGKMLNEQEYGYLYFVPIILEYEYSDDELNLSSEAKEIVRLVNQEREKVGSKPLIINSELCKVAQLKAEDLRDNNYYAHISPTYGAPRDMMRNFGIKFKVAGENLTRGQRTPADTMTAFMNSEPHKINILYPDYEQIGVGFCRNQSGRPFWVQMFIK